MSLAFAVTLAAMFGLAALGTPISLSMIVAAVAYLAIKGQDLGLAAEQIIQGLYDSFVILAIAFLLTLAPTLALRPKRRNPPAVPAPGNAATAR